MDRKTDKQTDRQISLAELHDPLTSSRHNNLIISDHDQDVTGGDSTSIGYELRGKPDMPDVNMAAPES